MVYRSGFLKTEPAVGKLAEPALKVYDRVELLSEIFVEGRRIPKGAAGTVLIPYRAGKAFEVEFTSPIHTAVGVEAKHLRLLRRG